MDYLEIYVFFLFILKISFLILNVLNILYQFKHKEENEKLVYIKDRIDFVFIILMSLLLIYVFNPMAKKQIELTSEMRILLFALGIILIIGSNWNIFIQESIIYKSIEKS